MQYKNTQSDTAGQFYTITICEHQSFSTGKNARYSYTEEHRGDKKFEINNVMHFSNCGSFVVYHLGFEIEDSKL